MKRTKKQISNFLKSLALKKNNDDDDHNLPFTLWEHPDPLKLLNFGLIGGYGHAVHYKGHGVVFVGCSGTGIIDLVKKIKQEEGYVILTENKLLLFDSKKHNKFWIYKHPYYEDETWKETINYYADFLTTVKKRGPELEIIVHLNEDSPRGNIKNFVRPNKRDILGYLLMERVKEPKRLSKKIITHPRFENVTFLEYLTSRYDSKKDYKEIKSRLDEILN